MFYENYTDDAVDPDTPDGKTSTAARSGNPVMYGTFEGDINARASALMKNKTSSAKIELAVALVGINKPDTNLSPDQEQINNQNFHHPSQL